MTDYYHPINTIKEIPAPIDPPVKEPPLEDPPPQPIKEPPKPKMSYF